MFPRTHQLESVIAAVVGPRKVGGKRSVPHSRIELSNVLRIVVADIIHQHVNPPFSASDIVEDFRDLPLDRNVDRQ